jgi:hypothetical protein
MYAQQEGPGETPGANGGEAGGEEEGDVVEGEFREA